MDYFNDKITRCINSRLRTQIVVASKKRKFDYMKWINNGREL